MTAKRYLTKNCFNCVNIQRINYGWGKQEIKDCKGRDLNSSKCCDVFMPSKQVKNWLKFNSDYELISVDEAMGLKE